jgi:hypothetical protein
LHYRVLPSCIIVWLSNPERWPDTLEVCIAPDSMTVWVVGASGGKLWVKVWPEGHKVEWL